MNAKEDISIFARYSQYMHSPTVILYMLAVKHQIIVFPIIQKAISLEPDQSDTYGKFKLPISLTFVKIPD